MGELTLDDIVAKVLKSDTQLRIQASQELQDYLSVRTNPVKCDNIDRLIDGLVSWVSSSNFKVSLHGLDCLIVLVERMDDKFRCHIGTVIPAVIDRLGDSKDQVREEALALIQKLMGVSTSQYVFERLMKAFVHKNWRVREEVLNCLQQTINVERNRYGAGSLVLSKLVPSICKLLGDPNSQVRDTAINTLVEIYRHVGEKVRVDLGKKGIPSSRLSIIYAKFDDVKRSGGMLVNPEYAPKAATSDESDSKPSRKPWNSRVTPMLKKTTAVAAFNEASHKSTTVKRSASAAGKKIGSRPGSAGAVTEEFFVDAYEEVPNVSIFSSKSLEEEFNSITSILNNDKNAWEQRCNALKKIRGLVIAGAKGYDCFTQCLRFMEDSLVMSAKDLRSQVVREACITLAFLSSKLGRSFEHAAESVLPTLFLLLQNSAKIMSTSGLVCINLIIKHTHGHRLIPIITGFSTSKSTAIRKNTCLFILTIVSTWDTHSMERHVGALSEAIRRGIEDPDSEARATSRKAFWKFSEHFKQAGDKLFNSLDTSKQRGLQGEASGTSSVGSLSKNSSKASSAENLRMTPGIPARRSMRVTKAEQDGNALVLGPRSNSDVNTGAASRARSRHTQRNTSVSGTVASRISRSKSTSRENLARRRRRGLLSNQCHSMYLEPTSSYSLETPPPPPPAQPNSSSTPSRVNSGLNSNGRVPLSNGRATRTRNRIGVSQSQPGSRSGSRSASPSSKMFSTMGRHVNGNNTSGRTRRRSGIPVPRSQGASRENSPSRYGYSSSSRERRMSGGANQHPGRELTQKNILAQRVLGTGRDAEQALESALQISSRKRWDSNCSDGEDSDVSSVCSYGSNSGRAIEDPQEILAKMASPAWSERKEGLHGLQMLLQTHRILTRQELKRTTELFTRMFVDPHSKVFSLFLDTLMDFVGAYKQDLSEWLFVLMTRLLQKTGSDLLGSIMQRVDKLLAIVTESFPYDEQFRILTKFIVDQTQTPNAKVKVSMLCYMENLTRLMDPSEFANSSETRLAVSRIISWTSEAKSADVRKASQAVLIALFELNTPEFSSMLSVLPKTFQEGVTKLLRNYVRSTTTHGNEKMAEEARRSSPRSTLQRSPRSVESSPRYSSSTSSNHHYDDIDNNMNSEEVYKSLQKTTAEIQNYTFSSRGDMDSGYLRNGRMNGSEVAKSPLLTPEIQIDSTEGNYRFFNAITSVDDEVFLTTTRHNYSRPESPLIFSNYPIQALRTSRGALTDSMLFDEDEFNSALPDDVTDAFVPLLKELSNHNERFEERKSAMIQLIRLTRENSLTMWDDHFKTVLLLMLETLGDSEASIRALALRVLREILRNQPDRFKDYVELTILKILEAHKDSQTEVVRAAEDTSATLANSIPPEQCVRVLCPIIQTADYPINQAAIKMLTKVIELMDETYVLDVLSEVVPVLLKSYDHQESSVRKASVFCLVAIHCTIGDDLKEYLKDLPGSKMKLLNLYIKRAQQEKQNQAPLSPSSTGSR
ncbi:CLIP-associating protein 1-like isoform X6 [Anneissia japonica]|uniref:CLIP-associating protein 1-like isoform X6 n=1 Tax=Anneissia japonica TaxID=1529436 RepID=UPI0014255B8E|nr:CLIP-associating protein 1-like isoform X6 [Anneissia japonica]